MLGEKGKRLASCEHVPSSTATSIQYLLNIIDPKLRPYISDVLNFHSVGGCLLQFNSIQFQLFSSFATCNWGIYLSIYRSIDIRSPKWQKKWKTSRWYSKDTLMESPKRAICNSSSPEPDLPFPQDQHQEVSSSRISISLVTLTCAVACVISTALTFPPSFLPTLVTHFLSLPLFSLTNNISF